MSGSGARDSTRTSSPPATSAAAKQPRIAGEVHPRFGPSMIPNTSPPSSTTTSSWPSGSKWRPRAAFDSGTNRAQSITAATATGTLIQKTERQPIPSTSTPPRTGPRDMLTPMTAPQTPMAFARSRRSRNVLVMMDIATGLSMEPPTACSARNAMSAPVVGAALHSNEPRPNRMSPVWNTRRRPIRSAVDPASRSRHAITSV